MKKHIRSAVILAFALCVVVVIGAVNAYALQSVTGTGTLGGSLVGTLDVTTSNKVQVCYVTGTTASQAYAAGSDHKAGNKIFGTGSKTSIYYITKDPGEFKCQNETSALTETGFVSSGWTAQ